MKDYCRICRKPRNGMPPKHEQCESCGMPLVEPPPMKNGVPVGCPKCCRHSNKTLENGRFWCSRCSLVYEGLEFGQMSHSDPEINAQRNEEYQLRQAARKRSSHY